MADVENEFQLGYVSTKRNNKGQELGATNKEYAAQTGNTADRSSTGALRAYLQAGNGTYYTNARLNSMTKNDLMYAARQMADPSGIK